MPSLVLDPSCPVVSRPFCSRFSRRRRCALSSRSSLSGEGFLQSHCVNSTLVWHTCGCNTRFRIQGRRSQRHVDPEVNVVCSMQNHDPYSKRALEQVLFMSYFSDLAIYNRSYILIHTLARSLREGKQRIRSNKAESICLLFR